MVFMKNKEYELEFTRRLLEFAGDVSALAGAIRCTRPLRHRFLRRGRYYQLGPPCKRIVSTVYGMQSLSVRSKRVQLRTVCGTGLDHTRAIVRCVFPQEPPVLQGSGVRHASWEHRTPEEDKLPIHVGLPTAGE